MAHRRDVGYDATIEMPLTRASHVGYAIDASGVVSRSLSNLKAVEEVASFHERGRSVFWNVPVSPAAKRTA
jgi:hypothetical protein